MIMLGDEIAASRFVVSIRPNAIVVEELLFNVSNKEWRA